MGKIFRNTSARRGQKISRIEYLVGEGSVADRHRQMADMKRARVAAETDYPGYATFQGHLLDWGVKLILMKTATPVEVLGYTLLLAKMAEEQGGVRTAYQYDVLARTAMAKDLEAGDPQWNRYFCKVDRELLGEAKDKIKGKAGEAARATGSKGGGKGAGGKGAGGKGDSVVAKGGKGGAGSGSSAGGKGEQPPRRYTPPRSRSPWHSKQKGTWNYSQSSNQKKWERK